MHLPLTHDTLAELARIREGNLAETPFCTLLVAFAVYQKTAVLELTRGPLAKSIVFDEGSPIDARSNVATETIGRFLVSTGKISEEDYRSALASAAARDIPFEDLLIERKLITPDELVRVMQQNLARKLLDPFGWQAGTFRVSYDVPETGTPMRVRVAQLALTGAIKLTPQTVVDDATAALQGKILVLNRSPFFAPDEIRLAPEQAKVADAVKHGGIYSVLAAESGMQPDDFRRVLYGLLLVGLITTADQLQAAPSASVPPPRQERKPSFASGPLAVAPPASPLTPAPSAVDAALRDELLQLYVGHRKRNPYDLLGVSRDATGALAGKAYLRLVDRFNPAKFDNALPDTLREKAEDIILAAARAYADIADPSRREVPVATPRPAAERVQPQRELTLSSKYSKTDLLDPEAQYRKGRELFAAGKAREALTHFEFAADCDAQNATYAAEVAWTKYHLGASTGQQALTALKHAMRIDTSSGLAYLYAGRIQSALGNRGEAEAFIRRAGALMKGDKRPADAMRELMGS